MEKSDMPVNFNTALVSNPEAMQKFESLSEKQKWQVLSGTHAVESRDEMKKYVENIITAY